MRYLFLLSILVSLSAFSKNISSISNGDWNNVNTWNKGTIPNEFDTVIINHEVFINQPVSIYRIVVKANGVWDNSNNFPITLSTIQNYGAFIAGKGKYTFINGSIKSNSCINIHQLELLSDLNNSDSLNIIDEFISNNHLLNNLENSVLLVGTTEGKFNKGIINLEAPNNSIVLNRNSFQTLPKSVGNIYQNIFLNNKGKVDISHLENIKFSKLLIGEKSSLQMVYNTIENIKTSEISNFGQLKMGFNHKNDWIQLNDSTQLFYNDSNSMLEIETIDTLLCPAITNIGNLSIKAENPSFIDGQTNQISINGNLYLHKNITWKNNNGRLVLKKNWTGHGKYIDELGEIKLERSKYISLPNIKIRQLTINECDSVWMPFNSEIINFNISNSSVKLNSLNCKKVQIDEKSIIRFNGTTNTIDSIINRGKIWFNATNGNNTIKLLINDTSAEFKVKNGGDFKMIDAIINHGNIIGCDQTNCNWEFLKDTFNISGKGTLKTPRTIGHQNIILNENIWEINTAATGKSTVINSNKISIGANDNQIDWNIIGNQNTEISFNRKGNQTVNPNLIYDATNLIFENEGRKSIVQSYHHKGNLTIKNGCELYLDTFRIIQNGIGSLNILDSSILVIGKTNSLNSGVFPMDFNPITCSEKSTVSYQSMGNQEIKGDIEYGNLSLNNGAVDSATFYFKGDSVIVNGDFNQKKSSGNLLLTNQNFKVKGNWEGPGNLIMKQSNFALYGNGLNYGNLLFENSIFYYLGNRIQKIKIGKYTHVVVNKMDSSLTTRGQLGELEVEKMEIINGKLEISTEKIFIDSLINYGHVEITSDLQKKRINNIINEATGWFENNLNEELYMSGNLINYGQFKYSDGKIILDGEKEQAITNKGNQIKLSKIKSQNDSLLIEGQIQLTDSLIGKSLIRFKNAEVFFDSLSYLKTPSFWGNKNSSLNGIIQVEELKEQSIYGWGIKMSDAKKSGAFNVSLFFDLNDYIDAPMPYYYKINPFQDQFYDLTLTIEVPDSINTEDLKIIKSEDEGMFFNVQNSFSKDNQVSTYNINTFSWWTVAKEGTTPLNIEILNFEVTRNNINWKSTTSKSTIGFLVKYYPPNDDPLWVTNLIPNNENNSYSINRINEPGYYQLYQINLDNDTIGFPETWMLLRYYDDVLNISVLNNKIQIKENVDFINLYNLNGKLIANCKSCKSVPKNRLRSGVYIVEYLLNDKRMANKIRIP